jgi:hypothetical protein
MEFANYNTNIFFAIGEVGTPTRGVTGDRSAISGDFNRMGVGYEYI